MRAAIVMGDGTAFAPCSRRGALEASRQLRDQVERWRALRFSWAAIGRNLGGYSESDVRALFDSTWGAATAAEPASPPAQTEAAVDTPRPPGDALPSSLGRAATRVLAVLNARTRTPGLISQAIGVDGSTVREGLKALVAARLAEQVKPGHYGLTALGGQYAQRLARDEAVRATADELTVLKTIGRNTNGVRSIARVSELGEPEVAAALKALRQRGLVERQAAGTFTSNWTGRATAGFAERMAGQGEAP